MTSTRYQVLRDNVDALRGALLPDTFEPTGEYENHSRVSLRSLSFRLMAHAEIEGYLEDAAHALFSEGWSIWSSSRAPSRVVLALLAYSAVTTFVPPDRLRGSTVQKTYDDFNVPIEKAQSVWRRRHKNSHGIKEEHVLGLLLPLGISATDLDPTLLADMSSYGSERGEAAHASQVRVQSFVDPKVEFDRLVSLVNDLSSIDAALEAAQQDLARVKTAYAV
jgi:hypothetical protein